MTGSRTLGLAVLALIAWFAASVLHAQENPNARVVFPSSVQQGSMVVGKVPPGSSVRYAGRTLRVTPYGSVVFGVGRDEKGPVSVDVSGPDGTKQPVTVQVTPRDWPVQHIKGVPSAMVNPPPATAKRIARENGQIVGARRGDTDEVGFAQAFIWPVTGRISGRFGNQRVYNGTPKSPHSGMDIAAGAGTPIRAPAAGTITLSQPDFYLTGGTVMIDHGHGISSNFLHMSRLDVKVGDVVKQGDVVGAVGSTGRSTGPHLHWGMTWFDVKIDPLLVLERGK